MITSKQDYYNFLLETQALTPTEVATLPYADTSKNL